MVPSTVLALLKFEAYLLNPPLPLNTLNAHKPTDLPVVPAPPAIIQRLLGNSKRRGIR